MKLFMTVFWEMDFSFSLTVLIQALYQLVFAGRHETDESRRGERVFFVRIYETCEFCVY